MQQQHDHIQSDKDEDKGDAVFHVPEGMVRPSRIKYRLLMPRNRERCWMCRPETHWS
jgi:hypothetical protein